MSFLLKQTVTPDRHARSRQLTASTLLVVLATLLGACKFVEQGITPSNLNANGFVHASQAEKVFVEELIETLTLEQKIGQMVQAEINAITPEEAARYFIGSVLNGGGSFPDANMHASRAEWVDLANRYYQGSNSDENTLNRNIPILWGTDAVHGHNNVYGATIFPHNIGLGAANNPELTTMVFAATARDVRTTGIKWNFSPTVAVAQNPRWGRTYESFSESPAIVSQLAEAAVVGLQGDNADVSSNERVIATAKHFIGDGGTLNGVDQGDVVLDESQLLALHGDSFQRAIDAGVQTVMASFNSWKGDKLHGHHYLLSEVLKEDMGFNGFVIGDWNGHAQVPGCSRSSCADSINAGVDMLMAPKDWKALIANTQRDVEQGRIPLSRIDDANRRILSVKYRAGLFQPDYARQVALPQQAIDSLNSKNREIARQAVRESMVLLKNNGSVLPVPSTDRLLVVGDHADSIAALSGGWSLTWQGDGTTNKDFPNGQTVFQAINSALTAGGGQATLKTIEELRSLIANDQALSQLSRAYDKVIMVYGERPYAEGGGDLAELRLPNRTMAYAEALERLQNANISTISLLISGRPLSVNRYINASDAFVAGWLPGTEANGIADVLIGKQDGSARYDFSGTLPFSWPRYAKHEEFNHNQSQLPPGDHNQENHLPAQFQLGYGLTYTDTIELAALEDLDKQEAAALVVNGMLPIFMKTVYEPWELYVGDEENWSVGITGNRGATENRQTLTVHATDNETQEDARKLSWSAEQYGQFYFQYQPGVDISSLASKNGALAFKVKVDTPPNNSVDLRMDCHYPCMGQLDVGDFLRGLPMNQWQDVAIDLSCFAQQGAQLNQINTPFLIGTSGELSIEIADIMIAANTTADQSIQCPRYTALQSNL